MCAGSGLSSTQIAPVVRGLAEGQLEAETAADQPRGLPVENIKLSTDTCARYTLSTIDNNQAVAGLNAGTGLYLWTRGVGLEKLQQARTEFRMPDLFNTAKDYGKKAIILLSCKSVANDPAPNILISHNKMFRPRALWLMSPSQTRPRSVVVRKSGKRGESGTQGIPTGRPIPSCPHPIMEPMGSSSWRQPLGVIQRYHNSVKSP